MSEHKWEIGPVKLLDGSDGHIDFIQPDSEVYRYFGRIKNTDGQWRPYCWGKLGMAHMAPKDYAFNLAPPSKKTMRFRRFICLYPDGSWSAHLTELESAEEAESDDPFAIFEIDREVTEGEGLAPT